MSQKLLRPQQTTHPEAEAWQAAVVANGGSVTGSTLSAVDVFCKAIEAAGIRGCFYRLNLFCGTGLEACLVPLYRGPSRSGTQFGNATDTNVNFVSGDYAETGATGGLKGNGSSKYLNTGLLANALGQTDRHLSVWVDMSTNLSNRYWMGTDQAGCGSAFWTLGTNSTTQAQWRSGTPGASTFNTSGKAHLLVSGNGAATPYANAVAGTATSGTAFTAPAQSVFVQATNRCGNPADYGSSRIAAYSFGTAMTAPQVSSFYSALVTFQTALSRQ